MRNVGDPRRRRTGPVVVLTVDDQARRMPPPAIAVQRVVSRYLLNVSLLSTAPARSCRADIFGVMPLSKPHKCLNSARRDRQRRAAAPGGTPAETMRTMRSDIDGVLA